MTREAVYGGGTTCPDGYRHQSGTRADTCKRCDAWLKSAKKPARHPIGCRCVDCASRSAAADCLGREA